MGNTHVEPATKENLLAYMEENDIRTPSRGIDRLLADHRELLVTRRENELLQRYRTENRNENPPKCKECGEPMEPSSHGHGCSTFWRCPACLRWGVFIPSGNQEG